MKKSLRIALAAAVIGFGLTTIPALAQNNEIQAVLEQLRLIQGDLLDLQREVYGDQIPARGGNAAVGPAVAAAPADNRQAILAGQFEVRLAALEREIRTLTGDIEQVGHNADQNQARLERLVEDVDFRLTGIEDQLAKILAAVGGGAAAEPGGAGGVVPGEGAPAPANPAAVAAAGPVEVEAGGDPGAAGAQVLGVLPGGPGENLGINTPSPMACCSSSEFPKRNKLSPNSFWSIQAMNSQVMPSIGWARHTTPGACSKKRP